MRGGGLILGFEMESPVFVLIAFKSFRGGGSLGEGMSPLPSILGYEQRIPCGFKQQRVKEEQIS